MKKSWVKQASWPMSRAPTQKMPSTVGRVQRDRPRSVRASMDRKRYIGSWREGSVLMIKRIVQLPRMETRYRRQSGREIQMCMCSSPGMPLSKKVEDMLPFSRGPGVIANGEMGQLESFQNSEMNCRNISDGLKLAKSKFRTKKIRTK